MAGHRWMLEELLSVPSPKESRTAREERPMLAPVASVPPPPPTPSVGMNAKGKSLPEILESLERQLIEEAYLRANKVKTETARLLGIKTSALYYKLEKYGFIVKENPAPAAE